jgi:hypothetical protein
VPAIEGDTQDFSDCTFELTMGMHKHFDVTIAGRPTTLTSLVSTSIVAILMLGFSVELFAFANVQQVWIDESTQLSGISLKFWQMLRWLAGEDVSRFGVPGDRMPPVSYILDWMWFRLVGPSEFGLRLLHSAFVAGGALILACLALRERGMAAAVLALLFLVLSPKLIQTGVEIRAYPVLFAVTCAQIAIFLKLVPRANGLRHGLMPIDLRLLFLSVVLGLIATYCHFYGLVSTCAFFLALGFAFWRSVASLTAIAASFGIVIIGAAGLVPFVSSAVEISSQAIARERTGGRYLTYFLTLFGDSANMVLLPAAVAFLGGTVALLGASAVSAWRRIWREEARSFDWLHIVVLFGFMVPILASLIFTRFDAIKASYSSWLLAPLALLVAAGGNELTGYHLWDKAGRFAAVGATVLGAFVATAFFLLHQPMFVHGPGRFVSLIFDQEGTKAIIYEAGAAWGFTYFPLVFSHGGQISQYRESADPVELIKIEAGGADSSKIAVQDIDSTLANYEHLFVVDTRLRTYRELRKCVQVKLSCPSFGRGVAEDLVKTGRWKFTGIERSFGIYDSQVKRLDRLSGMMLPTITDSR